MILLYNDTEHNKYFKVRVEPGIYLVEGAVVQTCDDAGMKAVCSVTCMITFDVKNPRYLSLCHKEPAKGKKYP